MKSLRSSLSIFALLLILGLVVPNRRDAAQEVPSLPGQLAYVEDGTKLYLVWGECTGTGSDHADRGPAWRRESALFARWPLPGVLYVNDKIVLFSILLWASALVAIMILMLYLWRTSPAPGKLVKHTVEPAMEEKPVSVSEPAVKPGPEEVEAAFQEGVDFVHAGRAEEGIRELKKVITAEPENEAAWFWLGIASVRQEDYRSAERCFLQSKKHGHPQADKALDWLRKQRP